MSIKREDLDADRIDFDDVGTGKRLPFTHPGEILRDDFLHPMKISVYTLALAIKVHNWAAFFELRDSTAPSSRRAVLTTSVHYCY
jgi:hypothetical protein